MIKLLSAVLVFLAFAQVRALEVKGELESISNKAEVIQVKDGGGKVHIIKFNDDTELVDADSMEQFTPSTKVRVVYEEGKPATVLARILVKLPAEKVVTTADLEKLMKDKAEFFLGDSRPPGKCGTGYIPGAVNTFSKEMAKNLHLLPKDKNTLLIFYCGGPSCPLSPESMKIAEENGYTNAKVYVEGYPDWKKSKHVIVVNSKWLKDRLNENHVIIDVRSEKEAAKGFITSAVNIPVENLAKFDKKQMLPNLRDKSATVVLYDNKDNSEQVIKAFQKILSWKYKNLVILEGGFDKWKEMGLSVSTEKLNKEIKFVKKLEEGSVENAQFVEYVKNGGAAVIDVRGSEELSSGVAPGSLNIPLDSMVDKLDSVPKDKPVVLYCETGARACLAYNTLKQKGYTNVKYLNDSMKDVLEEAKIKLAKPGKK